MEEYIVVKYKILLVYDLGGPTRDFYGEAFAKAWETMGHTVYRKLHTDITPDFARSLQYYPTKPDFLFHSYNSIPLDCVDTIRESGITTVLYVYDEPFEFPKTKGETPHYDISLNGTYRQNIKDHNELGANMYFLPQAVDPEVYHPVELTEADRAKYGADISFIGTLDSRRKDRGNIEGILKQFNHKIWGPGTTGWVGPEECNKIYSASKIIFNPPAAASLDPNRPIINTLLGEHTCRVYNTAAARAFQLVHVKRGTWSPYIEREEIVSYEEGECMRDIIRYYLEHEEERQAIATRAYLRTLRDHTFLNRAQAVVRYVELYKAGKLPGWV
jgi:spore maturation protein CgeB